MNANPSGPLPSEWAEAEPLLPFAERELPADRLRFHKEHLMTRIHEDLAATAIVPTVDTADAPARAPRPRPLFARRMILLPAVAALAGVLATGAYLALTPADGTGSGTSTSAGGLTTRLGTVDPAGAGALLDRISLAAADVSAPGPRAGAGQFIYIESKQAGTHVRTENGKSRLVRQDLHRRQVWKSADGIKGWLIEPGNTGPEGITLEGPDETGKTPVPHLGAPSYDYLATLPTQPDALLRKIYKETAGQGNGPDQQAFTTIGDLLGESSPPARLAAALYKAAAKIPGVVKVDDAVDAAGRRGVAVARLDESGGNRTEWIFDPKTFAFLGSRSVQVQGNAGEGGLITPGTVISTSAVMTRAVVGGIKELPVR